MDKILKAADAIADSFVHTDGIVSYNREYVVKILKELVEEKFTSTNK